MPLRTGDEPATLILASGDQPMYQYQQTTMADKGIYHFCSDFSLHSCKDAIAWILDSNLQQNREFDHLTLIISSNGGDVFAAFALIDVMRGSSIPVHTVGLGIVASAGLLTFIAGEKGHRIITPNTSILSHQWSAGMSGKEHELIATQKQYDLITDRFHAHYKKYTGLSKKIIETKLLPAHDVWLSAEEAIEYKLADKIKDLR